MINLLPKRRIIDRWYLIIVASSCFFIGLLGMGGYYWFQEQELKQELSAVGQRRQLLLPTFTQLEIVDAKRQIIITRQQQLIKLTERRIPWHAALVRVSMVIPASVRLTAIDCRDNVMKLSGLADDNLAVTNFFGLLQHEQLFSEVALVKSEQVDASAVFEITVIVKGG